MRRIGDTGTETCTYSDCIDFTTEIGQAMFNKTFAHREFKHQLEQDLAYTTLATYSSGTARQLF
eukprot:11404006-Karenia_brevis.AAC.1